MLNSVVDRALKQDNFHQLICILKIQQEEERDLLGIFSKQVHESFLKRKKKKEKKIVNINNDNSYNANNRIKIYFTMPI